jgi:hypothetical protein
MVMKLGTNHLMPAIAAGLLAWEIAGGSHSSAEVAPRNTAEAKEQGAKISSRAESECDAECSPEEGLAGAVPLAEHKYAVVPPVGKQTIKMISQAPRLDTLDGKTIAVVGGSSWPGSRIPRSRG